MSKQKPKTYLQTPLIDSGGEYLGVGVSDVRGEISLQGNLLGRYLYLSGEAAYPQLEALCAEWRARREEPGYRIVVDTETQGLLAHRGKVWLIQIADADDRAVVVDAQRTPLEPLLSLLKDGIPTVGHNIKFDNKWLMTNYGVKMCVWLDTMIGAQIALAGIHKGFRMEDLALKFLGIKMDKSISSEFDAPFLDITDRHIRYAATDVLVNHRLIRPILDAMHTNGVWKNWVELESPAASILTDMEVLGCPMSWEKLLQSVHDFTEEIVRRDAVLQEIYHAGLAEHPDRTLPPILNASSPDDTVRAFQVFYDVRLPNSEKETFVKCQDLFPLAKAIVDVRSATKIMTTYLLPWRDRDVNPNTFKTVHTDFRVCGAETGRIQARSPNLMNIPPKWREIITAEDGWSIISGDLSQYELRVMAVLSGEPTLIESYRKRGELYPKVMALAKEFSLGDPDDLVKGVTRGKISLRNSYERDLCKEFIESHAHRRTGAMLMGVPLSEVTEAQRAVGKCGNFSTLYGAGPPRVQATLAKEGVPVSRERAAEIIDTLYQVQPSIASFIRKVHEDMKKGYVETLGGRRRFFDQKELNSGDYTKVSALQREAVNILCQGQNADVLKRSLIMIDDELRRTPYGGARMLLTVHDEIVLTAPQEYAEEVADLTRRCMVEASDLDFHGVVPTEVSMKIGKYWSK